MTLTRATEILRDGMANNLHVGAQLHVAAAGKPIADIALGLAAPGREMTPDSMMTWLSTSKIAASLMLARLWQEGHFDLDDPVAKLIPEFAARGKEAITIRHVWTHTCGLLHIEDRLLSVRYAQTPAENIALICAAPAGRDWPPGRRAGYQTAAAPLIWGEIVARIRGGDFREIMRAEIFLPLGMKDSWLGMPLEIVAQYRERLGRTFDTSGPTPKPEGSFAPDAPHQLAHVMPGGNGRGPMRELARLLETLRRRGAGFLAPQTVEAMIARQRTGLIDESWGAVLDWGLGLTLDSKIHHAGAAHLYGYGRHASARTFGHSGFRTTLAMCDPDADLVIACSWNGMVADDAIHSARQNALCDAIYGDLGFAP
jgi:CubicO group peptidase (beta-lactamase class C family)